MSIGSLFLEGYYGRPCMTIMKSTISTSIVTHRAPAQSKVHYWVGLKMIYIGKVSGHVELCLLLSKSFEFKVSSTKTFIYFMKPYTVYVYCLIYFF